MPENFPAFESDDEMREWFETADLSGYQLDQALEVGADLASGIAYDAHRRRRRRGQERCQCTEG